MFARVARAADAFDALTSHRPYGEATDQYQALNTMAGEMREAFDGALLRKFISDRGKIRARRVTGVTVQQQRQIARAVKNARELALLPYPSTTR